MNEYRPPRLVAYLSSTSTAGIGFVGCVMNWRARGSAVANAKRKRITIAVPRMRASKSAQCVQACRQFD
jgi:hypothetical protein